MVLHKKRGFVHKYPLCQCNNGARRRGGLNALIASLKSRVDSLEWIKREFVLISQRCICIISVRQMSLIGCRLCSRRTEDAKKLTGLPEQKGSWLVQGGGWGWAVGGVMGAPEPRPGHFSAVITLCVCSPRGTVAAVEGSHTMMDVVSQKPPVKCQMQLMKIWHIVPRPRGRCTISFSLSRAGP